MVAAFLLIAGRRLLLPRYLKHLMLIRVSAAWLSLLTGFALSVASMASGAVTWIGVLLVGLAVRRLTEPCSRLATDRLPAATV